MQYIKSQKYYLYYCYVGGKGSPTDNGVGDEYLNPHSLSDKEMSYVVAIGSEGIHLPGEFSVPLLVALPCRVDGVLLICVC